MGFLTSHIVLSRMARIFANGTTQAFHQCVKYVRYSCSRGSYLTFLVPERREEPLVFCNALRDRVSKHLISETAARYLLPTRNLFHAFCALQVRLLLYFQKSWTET